MNNETNISNNISLESNVTIKIVNNKKTIKVIKQHNETTKTLFSGIMYFLATKQVTNISEYTPNYLGVGKGRDLESYVSKDHLNDEYHIDRPIVDYLGMQTETDDGVKQVFRSTLPYNYVQDKPINELGIFGTNTGNSLLARVQLEKELKLEPNQSLIVEWTFGISNSRR